VERYDKSDLRLVFVDIDKGLYEEFFEKVRSKVISGGLVIFHNACMVPRLIEKLRGSGYKVATIPTGEGILLVKIP